MNEIKNMWKHNPFTLTITLAGAITILITVFISDYYHIRNTFLSAIVFSGAVVMMVGAWVCIFYGADRKKPYDEWLRLFHESEKNGNSDNPVPVEGVIHAQFMQGYIQALSDYNLVSYKQLKILREALKNR